MQGRLVDVDTVANLGSMYKSPGDAQALTQPGDHTMIGQRKGAHELKNKTHWPYINTYIHKYSQKTRQLKGLGITGWSLVHQPAAPTL